MRQVMESRGLGKFVISMERRKKRSDSGLATNRRGSRSADEREHGPEPQGSQIASTQGTYTAYSQKSCGGQAQDQDHTSCSTQGSQNLSRQLSIIDKCDKTHDPQLLYFRYNTQINVIIQHRHQGTKYRGKQFYSAQINSCINVALENLALAPSHSTYKMRIILSSHAAKLQVLSTPTGNLTGRRIIFKVPSYLPSILQKALLPPLPSWPDSRSGSSTMEARCPLAKDREGGVIVPLTNIDQQQSW